MEQQKPQEVYEPPALLEVGDFTGTTRGLSSGNVMENGVWPYVWYILAAG
ncbi:lasso RiPP family leader peptide-containing protein [Streptomyces sp. NPDC049577]